MGRKREFYAQVGDTKPDRWIPIQASTMRGAAVKCAAEAITFGEVQIAVYVTGPHLPSHPNGAPIIVHRFDLVVDRTDKLKNYPQD